MGANFSHRWKALTEAHPKRVAILYMLISTAGFSAMNICVRLASETLESSLIVTLRNLMTLVILIPFVMPNGFAVIRTTRLRDHVTRSMVGAIGMLTWTYCIAIMPLVHATALSFTTPLLVTLFAMLVLKEKSDARHFIALGIGFIGTLVILRPSVTGFEWNSLWVLLATSAWAVTSLLIQSLSRTEPPLRMIFYMNLFMFLIALPFGFSHWQWPTPGAWFALLGVCCCSILMHFTMVKAYALASAVTLMPFDFTRLIYTSIFAYLIFGETSDAMSWVGAAIIITSAILAAPRRMKREATVD